MTIRIKCQKLATAADLQLPAYESPSAAGADLRAALPEGPLTLAPMQRAAIATGLIFEIAEGFEGQVRPRSGLALRHGVTVANAPGTIDSDYRGEVAVILINLGTEAFVIEHGMRIAQIIFSPVTQAEFTLVDSLNETQRGADGFGSTGL
jgi:dUTP pyrophosphatase